MDLANPKSGFADPMVDLIDLFDSCHLSSGACTYCSLRPFPVCLDCTESFDTTFQLLPKILAIHTIMKAVVPFLALPLSSFVLAQTPYLDAHQAVLARRWAEEASIQKILSLADDIESEEDDHDQETASHSHEGLDPSHKSASHSHEESDRPHGQDDGLESPGREEIGDDDVKAILRYYAAKKLLGKHAQSSMEHAKG